VTVQDLNPDPQEGTVSHPLMTSLDFVGRVHGSHYTTTITQDGFTIPGWQMATTNFLYVDGHVENKNIRQTLAPNFEWGEGNATYDVVPH